MTIDTSKTLEVNGSPLKQLGLIAIGLALTAVSAILVIYPRPGEGAFWGYAGLVFFGLLSLLFIWRVLTRRGPDITLSPHGIHVPFVAAQTIPWRAVRRISTWQHGRQKFMVLYVDPAVESGLSMTLLARFSRVPNRMLGADGLCVTASGLKINYDTLFSASMAYWEAATGAPQSSKSPAGT